MSLHNNGRPADLVTYTLATLPDPVTTGAGRMIYVSDANSGVGAVAVTTLSGSPSTEPAWVDVATYAAVA